MSSDEDFASGGAGASETYPLEAGQIKKGGYIMIKGHPCKVTNVSTSKTGKHGHAKCNFTALDIFTGKKYEDIVPSSHSTTVPFVTRADYQLLDIGDDGELSLMEDSGDTKDDVNLPPDEALAAEIQAAFDEGVDCLLNVVSACGSEQVMGWKKMT